MKYGIISDIHGNLEALEVVLGCLRDVAAFLCLGDVVGYGPNPNECCEIVKKLENCVTIVGNHDLAAIGKYDITWFNPYARAAIEWTGAQLAAANKEFLDGLPERYDEELFTMVHGSLVDPPSEYITSEWEAMPSFQLLDRRVCFIGHTHVAEFYRQKEGELRCHRFYLRDGGSVEIKEGFKYIINCGGVGQPRDGNPRASFGIYDSDKGVVEVKRVEYPIDVTQSKMIAAGLPPILYLRLWQGR